MALEKDDPQKLPTPLTPQALMQDPAYQSFLRTSGIQEQLDLAQEVERVDRIQRARELRLQGIEEMGEQERENIAGGQETRGVLASGQTLKQMGRQERGQMRSQALTGLQADEEISDVRNASLEAALGRESAGGELLSRLAGQRTEEYYSGLAPEDSLLSTSSTVPGLSSLGATALPQDPTLAEGVGISRNKRTSVLGKMTRDF
jgi:hypothetical protein